MSGLVRQMHMSPTDGSVYVFFNRSRSRMKLLHWERGGYVIYYKRLEQGRISRKVFRSSSSPLFYSMRWDELLLFMEGVYPSAARRKRFNIQQVMITFVILHMSKESGTFALATR